LILFIFSSLLVVAITRVPEAWAIRLVHHKAVNFFSEHSREVMDWKFIVNDEIVSRRPASNILVNNSDVLLNSGLAGLGILHALRASLAPIFVPVS
jgi:hypothetical protein